MQYFIIVPEMVRALPPHTNNCTPSVNFSRILRLNNPETIESRRIGNQTSKNPLTNLKYSYFRVKIQTWQKHVPSQSRLRLKWWTR